MSSSYVRTQFSSFMSANSSENFVDLTAQYLLLNDVLAANGLTRNDPWLGVQYIGSSEEPIAVTTNYAKGWYREIGAIFLHVVARASSTVSSDILARTETLRNLLRGRRINDIIIESVTPPNFESGATLQLEGGYQSATIIVNFYRDLNL